ncbi:MAG TPA: hypothetical protein V6C97_11935 [Oculatellaceae cyanobacterium]
MDYNSPPMRMLIQYPAAIAVIFAIVSCSLLAAAADDSTSITDPSADTTPSPATPHASPMDEGIREYSEGKYTDALGHLNDALNSEFSSAKLHYYMGSCYMKLKRKEAAIREFRIAFALEPKSTPGKYAKQALALMGVDLDTGSSSTNAVYANNRRDQRDLSQAMVDYARDHGTNLLAPAFNGSYTPPGYIPGQNPAQKPH